MRATMGLLADDELPDLSQRLKDLRKELERKRGERVPQYVVAKEAGDIPPRTFQSWENGEVETEGENYQKLARYYTRVLGREITRNFILYGQEEPPALPLSAPTSPDEESEAVRRLREEVAGLRVELRSGLGELREAQAALLRRLPPGERGEEASGG